LPVIIFSQFACTSLWFASNAVLGDLQRQWGLGNASLSHMTSAVQFGFIVGTLLFAFFTIAGLVYLWPLIKRLGISTTQ